MDCTNRERHLPSGLLCYGSATVRSFVGRIRRIRSTFSLGGRWWMTCAQRDQPTTTTTTMAFQAADVFASRKRQLRLHQTWVWAPDVWAGFVPLDCRAPAVQNSFKKTACRLQIWHTLTRYFGLDLHWCQRGRSPIAWHVFLNLMLMTEQLPMSAENAFKKV